MTTYEQKCLHCGHIWQSRKPEPIACVSCKQYRNRKRTIKQPKPVVVKVIKKLNDYREQIALWTSRRDSFPKGDMRNRAECQQVINDLREKASE